ncbi:N-acetyltransferase [bacterium]|nr:N-acetyltransferase [bacterium]
MIYKTGVRDLVSLDIRLANEADAADVCNLVAEAFGEEGGEVSELVREMFANEGCLLWVAQDSEIRGVVGASRASLEPGQHGGCWVLAPLAVATETRGLGVGGKLVDHLLLDLKAQGAFGVFVYGDPNYYGRFGFTREAAEFVSAPFSLEHPNGWSAKWLKPTETSEEKILSVEGPLNKPDLW